MKRIFINPTKSILADIESSDAYYIICSMNIDARVNTNNDNVLLVPFLDTENRSHPYAFTRDLATCIMEFFIGIPDDADVFVCCDSGESRSPALAAALLMFQGCNDSNIWKDSTYRPNRLVYNIACEVFKQYEC